MIYKLEDILEQWKKDSIIDDNNLDTATIDCAKMHAKYLEMLTHTKMMKKKADADLQVLLKDKWLYFSGKMSKAEMDARGWAYDPFDGLKVMKSDMDHYYNTDSDLMKANAKVEYLKEVISVLEEILQTVKWRHQSIRNILEWKRFTSGA